MGKKALVSIGGIAVLVAVVFAICYYVIDNGGSDSQYIYEVNLTDNETEIIEEFEKVPLSEAPLPSILMPQASGKVVYSNNYIKMDASNISDGYVMMAYTGLSQEKLKVIITCPSKVKYTYNLTDGGDYEVFPLSDGNGKYNITAYKNITGIKYSTIYSKDITVNLESEFAPFLLPNQYVNYTPESKVVQKANELVNNKEDELEAVKDIYQYVVTNITYDKVKIKNVKSGYLPDLDDVLKKKKGICFDYAAVMTAMLRSQDIPCKLVIGYAGSVYHAWINVYTEESGWINKAVFFDGAKWKLMDPTYASSGKQSKSIMRYIENEKNYSAKYLY